MAKREESGSHGHRRVAEFERHVHAHACLFFQAGILGCEEHLQGRQVPMGSHENLVYIPTADADACSCTF